MRRLKISYEMTVLLFVLIIISCATAPILIYFHAQSDLKSEHWLGFWGGYAGSICTLLAFVFNVAFLRNESRIAQNEREKSRINDSENIRIIETLKNSAKIRKSCDQICSIYDDIQRGGEINPFDWEFESTPPAIVQILREIQGNTYSTKLRKIIDPEENKIFNALLHSSSLTDERITDIAHGAYKMVIFMQSELDNLADEIK